jgi:hypothetical protein
VGFSPDAASEHCASRGWRAAAKYNAERLRWEESTGGASEEWALAHDAASEHCDDGRRHYTLPRCLSVQRFHVDLLLLGHRVVCVPPYSLSSLIVTIDGNLRTNAAKDILAMLSASLNPGCFS